MTYLIFEKMKSQLESLGENLPLAFSKYLQKTKFSQLSTIQVNFIIVGLAAFVGILVTIFPNSAFTLLLIPGVLFLRASLVIFHDSLPKITSNVQPDTLLVELRNILSDVFLYLPLACVSGLFAFLIVSIVILLLISEFTGLIATQAGTTRRNDGPITRKRCTYIFAVITLLLGLFNSRAVIWLNAILLIVILLLIKTITNKVINTLEETKK